MSPLQALNRWRAQYAKCKRLVSSRTRKSIAKEYATLAALKSQVKQAVHSARMS
jgi:hypothetical protein